MNLWAMLRKELRELVSSYKLLFVPLTFALLGIMQPVTMKMLPQIMKTASNLPKGAVIQIPTPPPGEVMAGVLGAYSQIPLMVLVLTMMGAIAAERASGVAATVLTKPVGRAGYFAAKAIAYSLLVTVSLLVGFAGSAYYTGVLIGPVDWQNVAVAGLLYLPYLLLVVAATLCFSAFMPSQVAAGGTSIVTMMLLGFVPKYLGDFIASLYPGALTASATAVLIGNPSEIAKPLVGVLVLALAFFIGGWMALERQEI
ncbi:MAG TPA: ABC transporter permease subunit [Symbiobacteriaceae bacterium]|nr:ABC transporter permease subunit [Symbiobacteriaceae bacterium]